MNRGTLSSTGIATSSAVDDIDDKDTWLRRLGSVAIVVAIAGWVLWRTGPAVVPHLQVFVGVADMWPRSTVEPIFAYLLRVPLGPLVYQLLPYSGQRTYLVLHLVCLVAAGALLALWLVRRLGLRRALIACCVLAMAPITAVQLNWIGIYDAFSILAFVALLMVLSRGPLLQFAVAVLVGFQNFEQSLFAVAILLLVPAFVRDLGVKPRAVPLLAGLVVGKVALETYLGSVGAQSGSRLMFLATDGKARELLTDSVSVGPIIAWSALGGLWLYAIPAVRTAFHEWSRGRLVVAGFVAVVWFCSGVMSEDETRVLAMTSFPAVVFAAMHIANRHRDLTEFVRSPLAWGLILAPPLVFWQGVPLPMGITIG
ncbi:hypothetical protein [Antrihabitans cavernicola]|uniref:Glycosyltransferase RgtA/B/C/D-like domain-containing protein n=1 Tax=Antrihabitans cavernicola TaxID=2495913 RepID=A0A5A7S5V6_9NOCA|nr:hypothetical protein [Spelaeibacter cavernicola]KAA0018917.1 hypothetical protein FOY51_23030 [Spelaeibacter cavernicola]